MTKQELRKFFNNYERTTQKEADELVAQIFGENAIGRRMSVTNIQLYDSETQSYKDTLAVNYGWGSKKAILADKTVVYNDILNSPYCNRYIKENDSIRIKYLSPDLYSEESLIPTVDFVKYTPVELTEKLLKESELHYRLTEGTYYAENKNVVEFENKLLPKRLVSRIARECYFTKEYSRKSELVEIISKTNVVNLEYVLKSYLPIAIDLGLVSQCEVTGKFAFPSMLKTIDGKKVLKTLVYTCPECGKEHYIKHRYIGESSYARDICPNCIQSKVENRIAIEYKGAYYHYSKLVKVGDAYYSSEEVKRAIYGYHCFHEGYKPNMLDGEVNPVLFGTEVETQGPDLNVAFILNNKNLHAERDGSIGQGFEIISQPMSLNYLYEHYEETKSIFEKLTNAGQKSDYGKGCGLHIHVNREAFRDENAINRAIAIVNGFRENCEIIARRTNDSYYKYTYFDGKSITKELATVYKGNGRYQAINTQNTKTIEFRIFKGTLNPVTYMASIEFVNNIVAMANSNKKRIKFSELLDGKYLPKYVQNRIERNHPLNLEQVLDLQAWNVNDVKAKLSVKRDLIAKIKNFNTTAATNGLSPINLRAVLGA